MCSKNSVKGVRSVPWERPSFLEVLCLSLNLLHWHYLHKNIACLFFSIPTGGKENWFPLWHSQELVEYYKANTLGVSFPGLETSLRIGVNEQEEPKGRSVCVVILYCALPRGFSGQFTNAWDRTESIEGATGCRNTVHVWSLISVYGIYGWERITAPGRFPYSFREACEFFKVPRIGLVKVERLGQRLNFPTQGRRVAQTGTKPFSLKALGSDPQPGIEPGPHWREADMLNVCLCLSVLKDQ